MIDLDHFKEINDTLGHGAGDRLLKEIRPRVEPVLDQGDLLARLGGDEFALLISRTDNEHVLNSKAKLIVDAIKRPFLIDNLQVQIGASLGIAIAPQHGTSVGDLMKHADIAMYHAKTNKTGFATYSKNLDRYSRERLALLSDITSALTHNQFSLHFHPKICMNTGAVVSAEALLRWQHPRLGLLYPGEFIPVAEVSEQIHDITRWVINSALTGYKDWQEHSINSRVAVNLSARNLLDENLPATISELLEHYQITPTQLEVEITESTLIINPRRSRNVVAALHDQGIRIAIDDFGTGYSSLAYLRQFPIDEIKIDKSFIRQIDRNKNNAAIVRSTIDLAHSLSMIVVAEGVEDNYAWEILRDLGCDLGQSHFVCIPQPRDEFVSWLRHRTETAVA